MTSQPPPHPFRPGPSHPPPHRSGRAPAAGARPDRLGPGQKAALYVGGSTLLVLLLCFGAVATVGALTGSGAEPNSTGHAQHVAGVSGSHTPEAAPTSALAAAVTPTPAATPSGTPSVAESGPAVAAPAPTGPVVRTKTVTETRTIPFKKRTVKDASLAKGKTLVRTRGVPGTKKLTYEVTVTDGVQTGRRLVREEVTRTPVTEVTAIGTKETRRCDPNYSGACVPIASDVDCAGGSGNGPAYVTGPVRVVGSDIYDLDRDGDGWGCD